ncbi:UDP-glucose 4-epimerase GalE [Turicibacter sp. H121]|uniref:UDP-glucose 4-epimerase GalE n=1 Tax=Turicibacter sp. H121 TaxID=1712675 RepID=UPI000763120D|nr:UDP-glucose 4-epimerase GalE [Turicibacter sp. H121]AMC09025.1 UDP-glucose 4-epimerase [Turicibacter sp. H121]MCU7199972.1 UDP-glucose 4-epimerase GalE [Turicibacter sp. H121]
MKVLVTGGAGYIGSHAVYALIEQGHEVVVVDNLVTGHRQDVHKDATFYHGSIADYRFMTEVLRKEKVDGVIHFAAYSLVGESMTNPYKYYDNNMSGTNVLLKAMVDCGVNNIVFSSTAATYGEAQNIPILETDPTNPTNVYGETKLAMERMINWYHKAHGTNYVSLRYFNVAGAHPSGLIGEKHDPETHLIPIILQVASGRREAINVFGDDYDTADGTCIRDYIHVCDLAEAHILAMQYLVNGGDSTICNLGNGEGFSVLEMIEAAREVTNHPIPAIISPRRAGDPAKLIASSAKAQEILGWTPKHPAVKDMIASAWAVEKQKMNQ